MEEMNNNVNEEVTDTAVEEVTEEVAEEVAEEVTEEVEDNAPEAENEEAEGENNFSEEVMEVALSYDENGDPGYVEEERSGLTDEQKRRKILFDKITTGILIALLISPIAILLYIFLWFIFR